MRQLMKRLFGEAFGIETLPEANGMFSLECAELKVSRNGTGEGRLTMTGSTLLIFLLGGLIDLFMGGALCTRYLRHEIVADICPPLRRLQL